MYEEATDRLAGVGVVLVGTGFVTIAQADPFPGGFPVGDVFAAVGSSRVNVYTPTGTLVTTLNDASGTPFTTGMAFDASGNFYVTNFGAGNISKFSNTGVLLNTAWATTGTNAPESIVAVTTGPNAGTFFVGGNGTTQIQQFDANGNLLKSFNVAGGNGTGGTDWIDFQNDNTILYDGEGNVIKSFNIATNTQNADFATSPQTSNFALRVIPGGAFAGDVLAADSGAAELFDPTGAFVRSYTLPGNGGGDFALNLDPNGKDFWTGDFNTGNVWEVNIATGAIDNSWNTGTGGGTLFGLAVAGELTTVGPGPSVPEPASIFLLGGVTALLAWKLRRKLS